ncbi:MAG: Flp pilus assembly complex ATPase component TadA [Puniceicoccales bacterium]|jgi:general secretion pathway protein E|nr:Flp pilus assembly complex ATPase component TadA [Puniceicoccales bacterium]
MGGDGLPDQLLRTIVDNAWHCGASDVHLEPGVDWLRIRLRIDGQLVLEKILHPSLHDALLRRLKILCGLALDVTQLPQDGKWLWENGDAMCDVRVSTIPFLHGEGAVLRLLRRPTMEDGLQSLGFPAKLATRLYRLAEVGDGLFLLVGPTGCGKSTSGHAILKSLCDGTRKILSVEDPVEFTQSGVAAVSVAPAQGLTFATALRAVLRQSPDVIFLGEIRDEETAAIAVQAALTGHFVLGTLHCLDAARAVPRLRQLGVEISSIRAALRGALAQRLVRQLCPHCRTLRFPQLAWARWLNLDPARPVFHATGCEHCSGSGFKGQTVLWELWEPRLGQGWEDGPEQTLQNCLRSRVLAGDTTAEEGYAALGELGGGAAPSGCGRG